MKGNFKSLTSLEKEIGVTAMPADASSAGTYFRAWVGAKRRKRRADARLRPGQSWVIIVFHYMAQKRAETDTVDGANAKVIMISDSCAFECS